MTDPYVSGDDIALDDETAKRYRQDRANDDMHIALGDETITVAPPFPGYPNLRRFAYSDYNGNMELLSVSETSDGFLIGWARVRIGEEDEHEHFLFLG